MLCLTPTYPTAILFGLRIAALFDELWFHKQRHLREGYNVKFFFQSISWNTVSRSFHETWITFMKYFYFSIQHSLRMFLINKKIVFTEKRYRVKFNSIKNYLLLIKQKQKNSKIPKRIWMKQCSKTRSGKSACANIFLELLLTI